MKLYHKNKKKLVLGTTIYFTQFEAAKKVLNNEQINNYIKMHFHQNINLLSLVQLKVR